MCNCKCGWRFFTQFAATYKCPQCDAIVECEGKTAPAPQWPAWARLVEYWWRQPADLGLGDSFEHMAKWIGAEAVSQWLEKHGINCGCRDRKRWMNQRYPYSASGKLPSTDEKKNDTKEA